MAITTFFAKKLINYQSDKSLAFRLRKKRAERIVALIEECYARNGKVNIIDIGGTRMYWNIIPTDYLVKNKVSITLVNLSSDGSLPADDPVFTFCIGDACNLENFEDKSFHIAHSNSVIEHVGDNLNRIKFAAEIKRVAESYYLQTPNYWFPVEPHFVTPFYHWLPESIRIKLLMNFDLGWYKKSKSRSEAKEMIDGCRLMTKKDLNALFPEADVYRERIGFLVKSFVLIKKMA